MSRELLTARDIMTRKPFVVRSDTSIADAIRLLLRRDISGAPVVDENGQLVGILSERDCLRVLAVGEYDAIDHERERAVSEFMASPKYTVAPHVGIFSLADFFLTHHQRRLPVIEGSKLVGLVSRRDVLAGIHKLIKKRQLPTPAQQRGPSLYPTVTETSPDELGERLG